MQNQFKETDIKVNSSLSTEDSSNDIDELLGLLKSITIEANLNNPLYQETLSINASQIDSSTQEPPLKLKEIEPLKDNTLKSIAEYILQNNTKNIIILCGAGISTSAGIPDFRSKDGIYSQLDSLSLPYPEALFDISFFMHSPEPFYTLAKSIYPGNCKPTSAHRFIKQLQDEGLLMRCYTQNIDMLERQVGIRDELIVEAHGSFMTARCVGQQLDESSSSEDETKIDINAKNKKTNAVIKGCGRVFDGHKIKPDIELGKVPYCCRCGGLIKPDIVFFGEPLPERFHQLRATDFKECELVIVMGTSLSVQPFASLIESIPKTVPRLLINKDQRGVSIEKGVGFDFDWEEDKRDALFLGSCDDGCQQLAEFLGFKDVVLEEDGEKCELIETKDISLEEGEIDDLLKIKDIKLEDGEIDEVDNKL